MLPLAIFGVSVTSTSTGRDAFTAAVTFDDSKPGALTSSSVGPGGRPIVSKRPSVSVATRARGRPDTATIAPATGVPPLVLFTTPATWPSTGAVATGPGFSIVFVM